MSELATLGTRFISENADKVHRDLDLYAGKSKDAAAASDAAAGGSNRLSQSMKDMLASIERSTREIAELTRAQNQAAQAADAVAMAETRAAAATAASTGANIKFSHSFTQVTTDAGRAAAAIERAGDAATRGAGQAKAAAAHFDTLYDAADRDFSTQYARQMGTFVDANAKAEVSTRRTTLAALGLSRQMADVFVTGAAGMNPFLILIQQGPQVVDQLATMKMEGVGVGAAFRTMAAAAAPAMAVLGPLAIAATAVGAAFAIGAQQMNDSNKGMIKELGLTEDQLKKVKNEAITMGDVMKGTFNAAAAAIGDAFGPEIAAIRKAFNDWYDELLANTVREIKAIVGGFVGAYEVIKATWSGLPAAIGDVAIQSTNAVIGAVEKMINGVLAAYNKMLPVIRATLVASGNVAGAMNLREAGSLTLGRLDNPNAGAARDTADVARDAWKRGQSVANTMVDNAFAAIERETKKAWETRVRAEAGKAAKVAKGPETPRDQSDERSAQLAAAVAQARAEELAAQLGLTEDLRQRASIEKQILAAQVQAKQAQVDRQIASIADDKGLSNAKKAELTKQWAAVKIANERVAALQGQKVDRDTERALIKQSAAIATAEQSNQIEILGSQRDIARFAYQRRDADEAILKAQQHIEQLKLQEIIDTTASGTAEHEIAKARMAVLGAIHAGQTEAQRLREFERATTDAGRSIRDIADAVGEHDWGKAFGALINAVDQAGVAFATAKTGAERAGAMGSLLSAAGGAVGGKAGSVLGAAGSGFSAAGAAAGMAGSFGAVGTAIAGLAGPIGIAVAGFSLLSSVLGSDKAAKRAKLEKEAQDIQNARAIAQERANKQAELEMRILELSGDELAVTARRRQDELAALDAANQALARHVHALEDWTKAVSDAKDAQSKAEDALRTAYDAERDRLLGVISQVEVARNRLADAYGRERSAIDATIGSIKTLLDTLTGFQSELSLNPLAANDPGQQYAATAAQFRSSTAANIPTTGSAFLEASLGASATRMDFERDLAAVRRRTEEAALTAKDQLTEAEKQLERLDAQVAGLLAANDNLISVDAAVRGLLTAEAAAAIASAELAALDTQVGALININTSVLSVGAAINNLQSAIAALATAQAAKPAAAGPTSEIVGLTGYIDKNADLAALYASGQGMARGRTKEEFAAYHWERYGQAESRYYRPFDKGGMFSNGIVTQPTTFHNSVMGEKRPEAIMPLVMGPDGLGVRASGSDGGSKAELQALRMELETVNRTLTTIMMSNRSMEKQGDRIENEGVQVRGEAPGDPVLTAAA